jgi:glyoxylase-like metal-dependent hydrolase (beta-lactamase superfamily II)
MSETYRFTVGGFSCLAVSDGSYSYPPTSLFSNAPADMLRSELDRVGITTSLVVTPYTFLVVDTGRHRVLVDLGAGALGPATGKLAANLHDAGYGKDEIDCVVITHAHPDHVGGALDPGGHLLFSRSHYFVWRREWDYWFSDEAAHVAWEHYDFTTIARRNLSPMKSRLTLVDSEEEILPGVAMMDACGHTPGHVVIRFVSAGETLVYAADTVVSPLHLEHPDWLPVFDMLPGKAEASKRRIFDTAARENWLVMAQHFPPFPSLGHVARKVQGWLWLPAVQRPLPDR